MDTETSVNRALRGIVDGVVGFDTEYEKRKPTVEEAAIATALQKVGGNLRTALIAWQVAKKTGGTFKIEWDHIALCYVQLAKGKDVWIINIKKMRGKRLQHALITESLNTISAYPKELERILQSTHITKVGVGISHDIGHVYTDLGTDINNFVDVGCIARLLLAHKYGERAYQNLSLQTSAAEVLGYYIVKDEQNSDWTKSMTHNQVKCKPEKQTKYIYLL